jgi:hypothetical protein
VLSAWPRGGHVRQALGENLSGARRVVTEKLPHARLPRDMPRPPGEVRERAPVAAVDTRATSVQTGQDTAGDVEDMQGDLSHRVIDVPRLKTQWDRRREQQAREDGRGLSRNESNALLCMMGSLASTAEGYTIFLIFLWKVRPENPEAVEKIMSPKVAKSPVATIYHQI